MSTVIGMLAAGAAIAWGVAVVTLVRLARRLSGRRSLGAMLVNGIAWFDARNFRPEAAELVRRLTLAFAGFFGCIIAMAVVAMIQAGRA